mgnify:CR=1 FL=1
MTNVKFINRPFDSNINQIVDSLFSELPVLFRQNFDETMTKGSVPVNVKETAKGYELEFVAPGFDKTDFKVNLDKNLLTVAAEKKAETKQENEKQLRREFSFRSFKRTFTLDEQIDATNISATYVNGILVLNLPRKVEVKVPATEIQIN